MTVLSIFTRTAEEIKHGSGFGNQKNEDRMKRSFLKAGESIIVRIPDSQTFVEYYSHGGYLLGSKYEIYSSACTRHTGEHDAYCKAVKIMYEDLEEIKKNKGENSEEYKSLHSIANDLRSKRRMLFGFYNLDNGQPMILEVTGGQGDGLVQQIIKNEKKLGKFAFELSKNGKGVNTQVTLTLLDPDDELEPKQQENWNKTDSATFDHNLFEQVLYVQPEDRKVEDLEKIGFDVTRIGFNPPAKQGSEPQKQKSDDELMEEVSDLPF